MKSVLPILAAVIAICIPNVYAASPYSSNIELLAGVNPGAYVSLTAGNCEAFNAAGHVVCSKTKFDPSPTLIGDSASCIKLSSSTLDSTDWDIYYEFLASSSSDFSYIRYNYFSILQSCNYDVDVSVKTDGAWSSDTWESAEGPAIIEMSCIAESKADCVGTSDSVQAIRACKIPATESCLAATSSTPTSAFSNSAGVSGSWYDPKFSGSGFNIQMAAPGLLLYYYGWDKNNNRLWLTSDVGPTQISQGTEITLTMNETSGGTFLDPAAPSTNSKWGTLILNFSSCNAATATLSGNDGSETLNLRLLAGVTNLPGC